MQRPILLDGREVVQVREGMIIEYMPTENRYAFFVSNGNGKLRRLSVRNDGDAPIEDSWRPMFVESPVGPIQWLLQETYLTTIAARTERAPDRWLITHIANT